LSLRPEIDDGRHLRRRAAAIDSGAPRVLRLIRERLDTVSA
jgi:hypothetical protein